MSSISGPGNKPVDTQSYTFTVVDNDKSSEVTVQGDAKQIAAWKEIVGSDDRLSMSELVSRHLDDNNKHLFFATGGKIPTRDELVQGLEIAGKRLGVSLRSQDLGKVADTAMPKVESNKTEFRQTIQTVGNWMSANKPLSEKMTGAINTIRDSNLPVEDKLRLLNGLTGALLTKDPDKLLTNGKRATMGNAIPGSEGEAGAKVIADLFTQGNKAQSFPSAEDVKTAIDKQPMVSSTVLQDVGKLAAGKQ